MSYLPEVNNIFQSCTSTDEMIAIFDMIGECTTSSNEYKLAKKNLIELFLKDDGHSAAALVLSLVKSKGDTLIKDLRKVGAFRLSRYKYGRASVIAVSALVYISKKTNLSIDSIRYLNSIKTLHFLRADLFRQEQYLISQLNKRRRSVLKTLLVIVDRAFLNGWSGGNKSLPSNDIMHHSLEDLAEALSTIVLIFKREFGLKPLDWEHLNQDGVLDKNEHLELLKISCAINNFKRAETLIDGLPYNAKHVNDKVIVYSTDPQVEKSVRLGYIQQIAQSEIRINAALESQALTESIPRFGDVIANIFRRFLKHFVIIEDYPVKRLRFAVPAESGFIATLNQPHPYFEEFLLILQLDVDDFSGEVLWDSEIKDGIKVSDVLKIQRFFSLLNKVYKLALNEYDGEDIDRLETESVATFMHREAFLKVLGHVVKREVAEQLIEMLTLSDEAEHIDLQYRPFIKAGDYIVCSPSLVTYSNLVRNISVSNTLYTGWPQGEDPMVLKLRDALAAAGFMVEIEVEFPFGKDLDADVLALKDGVLFIFECKHAYHPCNVHELRNVHYHIKKGESQLDIRAQFLKKPELQRRLLKKLGWPEENISQVSGAIVTSTRVFHGSYSGNWLVVQANELMNIISRGLVRVLDGAYRIWKKDEFQVSDLLAYIDGETLTSDQLSTMIPFNESHPMGSRELVFESWQMAPLKQAEIFRQRYKYVHTPNG